MKSIDLEFDTKIVKVAKSPKKNSSLTCKEAHSKEDPPTSLHNVAMLDLAKVEMSVVKILKQATKLYACWHNIVSSGPSGLNNLLGLEHKPHEQMMMSLNLFKKVKELASPKKKFVTMVRRTPHCTRTA